MALFTYTEKKDTRSGFGDALLELGRKNPDIVALTADVAGSVKMTAFAKEFPERFFDVGIQEANMIGMAAGFTLEGKIPFASTFAEFASGRVYDQIRQAVAYSEKNVKIAASHSGLTVGEDGATHQALEDLGMMKMLPGMTVINTCDYNQTYNATLAVAAHKGPVYLRFGRPKVPNFTPKDMKFEIGKAWVMKEGTDVTVFATGHLVWEAVTAAETLEKEGISVELINIHTIKPLDEEAVLKSARKTGAVVTAEEHNVLGGLGESIARVLSLHAPVPQEYVAINDRFGESGKDFELMKAYGLDAESIVKAVRRVVARKKA
ncbi:MAG: transketolase family protein [Chlorobi bacterium]|nr:transketolase family protein [Chlorobiota bacterium]